MTRYHSHRFDETDQSELDRLYGGDIWWGAFTQKERDDATVAMGTTLEDVTSIADMSAGGAHITPMIAQHYGVVPLLGDYGSVYGYQYTGTLQQTVPQLPVVDLFVCSETIEHLTDPDGDLALIRKHCRYLLLTTPTMEKPDQVSHGHLWTWEAPDVEYMLAVAGFTPFRFEQVAIFGLWLCR